MLFHTPTFLVFFSAVVLCFAATRTTRARKLVLFLASCIFYMWWSPIFILLLLGPMLVDYNVARWLEETTDPRKRRLLLTASVVVNLGLLAFFKYATFLSETLLDAIVALGVPLRWESPSIALPIGISFFTFERMSYTIDVYRGVAPATRSKLDFALFISFFPRLMLHSLLAAAQRHPFEQRIAFMMGGYEPFTPAADRPRGRPRPSPAARLTVALAPVRSPHCTSAARFEETPCARCSSLSHCSSWCPRPAARGAPA